jgi:ATP-binding cassette subfamily C (CFTR/MRP) protein 1
VFSVFSHISPSSAHPCSCPTSIYSVCTNNTFSRSGQVGILARGALIAAACKSFFHSSVPSSCANPPPPADRKALKLNGKARTEISNAKLMSLISTSISRIDFASSFSHFSYTCIIQLIEIIVILLVSIGVSSLAGVALVFLSLFVLFPSPLPLLH